jgi:hypothetical protein
MERLDFITLTCRQEPNQLEWCLNIQEFIGKMSDALVQTLQSWNNKVSLILMQCPCLKLMAKSFARHKQYSIMLAPHSNCNHQILYSYIRVKKWLLIGWVIFLCHNFQ